MARVRRHRPAAAAAHPDCFNWLLHHEESAPGSLLSRALVRDSAPLPDRRLRAPGWPATAYPHPVDGQGVPRAELVTDAVVHALESIACSDIRLGLRETVQYGPSSTSERSSTSPPNAVWKK